MSNVQIIGGTFEKDYSESKEGMTLDHIHTIDDTATARLLAERRMGHSARLLMAVDSLEMQAWHREQIAQACGEEVDDRIVIVHGTDTKTDTGRYLDSHLEHNKTIVLTGAMRPNSLKVTDGPDNLDLALWASAQLPRGVWIAMNGLILRPGNARKNYETYRFEPREDGPYLNLAA